MVSLIERFYDLQDESTQGSITIDGRPIRSLPLLHLHRHIGLVSQNPVLFATTIRENLLYGCRPTQQSVDDDEEVGQVSDEQLQRACEMANAWEFAGLSVFSAIKHSAIERRLCRNGISCMLRAQSHPLSLLDLTARPLMNAVP